MHQQVTSQSHSLSVLNSLAARPFAPQQHHHPTSNPLPDTTQAILTRAARTGHHLSQLAIASDPHAMAPRGQANVALAQAKSFNLGQDRFFRQGEYQPSSQRSQQQLLANESPHLLKQTGGATRQKKPIQFKPKDIKSTHTLNVDNDGKITNSEAGRSDPPVSYPLNMAIKKGLVKSKDGDAVGGHLFKREYGGADNYSNVVTWSTKSESQFTTFENQYLEKAREDATGKGGVARQVNTEAKFSNFKVSLDDISLPDKETSDGQTIKNRTIQDEKNKKGGKQANHLLVNLIRGAVESIPDSVKASSKGVEAWEKSGKGDIMKVSESFDKEKVGTRFDYIMEGDQDEINEISRAVDKVKEM